MSLKYKLFTLWSMLAFFNFMFEVFTTHEWKNATVYSFMQGMAFLAFWLVEFLTNRDLNKRE